MRRTLLLGIIAVLAIGGGIFGVSMWYQGSHYVSTDNASVAAPLIPVTTLSAGQIIKLNVDVGARVQQKQSLAEIGAPQFYDATSRQGLKATPASSNPVESPVSGYVAAVWTYNGATVSPGVPIVTLFDDSNVWISANIDEGQIGKVHPGQQVEVRVDSLPGTVLQGKVEAIAPATAANFSLLPSQNATANFIKVAQMVPVKISIEKTDGVLLIPGGSAEVKIFIR